jgi:hypothetical protein
MTNGKTRPHVAKVPPIGLELPPETTGNSQFSDPRGAECGALRADSTISDGDLRFLIDTWPTLDRGTKDRIVDLARSGQTET